MDQATINNIKYVIKRLRVVSMALDNLEVKGRQNLDALLGSIREIDRAVESLELNMKDVEPPKVELEVVPDPEEKENDSK